MTTFAEKLEKVEGKWVAVAAIGGLAATYSVLRYVTWARSGMSKDVIPSELAFGNTGALKREKMKNGIESYNTFYEQSKNNAATFSKFTKMDTPQFVDMFYSLITDFYEYGWGQSFHFSPRRRGETFAQSIIRHEERIGDSIKLKPGMHALDAGCGVGGPMRAVAKHTGAKVTGITINEYQVQRAREHNERAGLSEQCTVVQGNFLELPFPENHFDGVFCVEAACHAPDLVDLYKEVFKVMKPGAMFASYEWLTTPLYNKDNAKHYQIIAGIAEGNALPGIRDLNDCLKAAKEAGFEVVDTVDVDVVDRVIPWHVAMANSRRLAYVTHVTTWILETIGWAPKGTVAVHEMLLKAAYNLEISGQLGIFTPMHLCVFKKP